MRRNGEVLSVEGLTTRFGGLVAVDNLSFELLKNQILGIIGPNGAGKTTVFNNITGFIAPTEGRILFEGKDITNSSPDTVARLGIARTFQNIRLFESMTVEENVMAAAQLRHQSSFLRTLFSTSSFVNDEDMVKRGSREVLRLLGLEEVAQQRAKGLTHGLQRRLEIARALALEPDVLLLDEPAAGLNPSETGELLKTIQGMRDEYDLSIILVEHDMSLVMNLCEELVVLNYGKRIARGTCQTVRSNKKVIEAYLGEDAV